MLSSTFKCSIKTIQCICKVQGLFRKPLKNNDINFFKKVAAPAAHYSQFTFFRRSLRNTNISKCLLDSLQRLPYRICPAALNRCSSAAEQGLGSVELDLMKAFITCGHDARHSTDVDARLR